MINNTTNTNTDTKSSTETNNLSRHESAHEKKMRKQRESRKIKKEEREKQPGYEKPKTGRPSNADRMSPKELEHHHQKRKKQQHNMTSDHRKKGNEAIQVVESDVKETRIDTAQALLSLNTSFQSSRTTDVQNLADAAKVLANTTPGAVRSVLGNSLDNVTAEYATALNNSVLTVKSSMKESMRRIHEMAPTLTSTVKTQRNIAGFDHDDNGNSDGDIDDMITFLLEHPDQLEYIALSKYTFVSNGHFFLRVAARIDLESNPVESRGLQRLVRSLVDTFYKLELGIFAPFNDHDGSKTCCNEEGGEEEYECMSSCKKDLFSSSNNPHGDSCDPADTEGAAAIIDFKRKETAPTGAFAQSDKKIIKDRNGQAPLAMSEVTIGPVSKPIVRPSLSDFLVMKKDCFKVPPTDFYSWLLEQDVTSMDDLIEACNDEDFLAANDMRTGGLKAFKKRGFINAVKSYQIK